MSRWTELSRKVFPPAEFEMNPSRAESFVGPFEGLFSDADLHAFRSTTHADAKEFGTLLAHPLHRHLVKLLVFATRHVPEWLIRPLLVAAADTQNPSFNKHFVVPCSIVHGRRKVVQVLIEIAMTASDARKAGAARALYWGTMRRHVWPDARHMCYGDDVPVEPIDDLTRQFVCWAAEEFARTSSTDVKRSLVGYLKSPELEGTEQGRRAIQAARNDDDAFVRNRIAHDLGETELIPCHPPTG